MTVQEEKWPQEKNELLARRRRLAEYCATLIERVEDELIPKLRTAERPAQVRPASCALHWVLKFSDSRASCRQLSEVLCSKMSKVRCWISVFGFVRRRRDAC